MAASPEARRSVLRLMSIRGARLAAQESVPPLVHWIVLGLTGGSLLFGFAVVSTATRAATSAISRALFGAFTGVMFAVARLIADMAKPFDPSSSSSYTLAADNVANAILAPTRRRIVAALARHADGGTRRVLPPASSPAAAPASASYGPVVNVE